MKPMRRGIIRSLMMTVLGGCSPAALLNATVSRDGYTIDKGEPYGTPARLKLDLYKPTMPRPDGKTVIFFYGGSWDAGNKDDYLFLGQALASRGITTIIPDYRLFPEVRFPTFIEDSAHAVRWAADRYGIDRLFIMGHSAGAHIALMLAANTPYLHDVDVDRMKMRAVIGLSGPYDFLPLNSPKLIEIFGGADNPDIEAITFAQAPLPPALLIQGEADTTVYPKNARNLAVAWRKAGAPVELRLYPGVGHIDVVAAFSDLLRKRAPTREDVLAYIDAH
jgi:acetyl esterase/lipase